jgi:hypothetical protein
MFMPIGKLALVVPATELLVWAARGAWWMEGGGMVEVPGVWVREGLGPGPLALAWHGGSIVRAPCSRLARWVGVPR